MVRTWLVTTIKYQMVVQEGLRLNIWRFLGVFYANNGMVEKRYSEWMYNVCNILIGIFKQCELGANVANSWEMTFQPGALCSGISE